ncbi:hypothetical protein LWI28_024654 [Acer negundo]|uniref:Uncharacterized protein n=1 Tax=Acer negundo TaxID=4023 RepID=A0AAD5J7U8_ACENE|nr:hypothetical protein LWI28_024654 [Acer negundo]
MSNSVGTVPCCALTRTAIMCPLQRTSTSCSRSGPTTVNLCRDSTCYHCTVFYTCYTIPTISRTTSIISCTCCDGQPNSNHYCPVPTNNCQLYTKISSLSSCELVTSVLITEHFFLFLVQQWSGQTAKIALHLHLGWKEEEEEEEDEEEEKATAIEEPPYLYLGYEEEKANEMEEPPHVHLE